MFCDLKCRGTYWNLFKYFQCFWSVIFWSPNKWNLRTLVEFLFSFFLEIYGHVIISPKFENFKGIMFLVAPAPSPSPHANSCTGHNFVTNAPIKFVFAIAIEVPDYKNLHRIGKTKWPLAAILYKNAQKACGVSNCVINSPINFIFGIAIDNT